MGKAMYLKFTNCYNRGDVNAYSAGGLAGMTGLSGSFKNCYSSGTISSTNDFSVNTCGTDKVNTPTLSNVYYNCSGKTKVGTSTSERYSSDFYTETLFWNTDVWSFSETEYPTLKWESE